jgi:hypothetical protein
LSQDAYAVSCIVCTIYPTMVLCTITPS